MCNHRLRAELAEAKQGNDILKRASVFFAAELDRPAKRLSPSSTTIVTSSESNQSCAP